jgi:hypothetical protein
MSVNRRLVGLAAGHYVVGIIAALLAPIEVPSFSPLKHILLVPLLASAPCQAFLLAVRGAASSGSPPVRVAGLIAGVVYLEALFLPIFRKGFMGVSTVTVTIATAALLNVPALGVRLIRFDGRSQPAPPGTVGFRFSIRGLMLVTAAVALLSAGARALQQAGAFVVLYILVWAMCFLVVGLVALWAVLGVGRPLRRAPIVFILPPVLGRFFAFATGASPDGPVYILLIMLLYSTLLFG